jgi:hypothetical protein
MPAEIYTQPYAELEEELEEKPQEMDNYQANLFAVELPASAKYS